MSNWTLLSNHGHVLVCLSRDPEARLRDVASNVGITERAVQKIVRDLQDGGMISVTKSGRRNCYRIHKKETLRHELEARCTLKDLIKVLNRKPGRQTPERAMGTRTEPPVADRPDTRTPVKETGSKPDFRPAPVRPEPIKPAADNTAGAGEPKASDSLEKQQGSLF